jgi:hypothetical protein
MVLSGGRLDNDLTFIQPAEAVMLVIFLVGVAGGAWVIYRLVHDVLHSIPRANEDLIFY